MEKTYYINSERGNDETGNSSREKPLRIVSEFFLRPENNKELKGEERWR